LGSWAVAVKERAPPVDTEVVLAVTESMIGASLPYGGGGAISWRVIATAVVRPAVMVTPDVWPWKRFVPAASKASARKTRLEPAGMLLMTPVQEPLDLVSSEVREDMSEADTVTLTRVMSLAERSWWTEAVNATEPVGSALQAERANSSMAAR
jgi:hypothetical protein